MQPRLSIEEYVQRLYAENDSPPEDEGPPSPEPPSPRRRRGRRSEFPRPNQALQSKTDPGKKAVSINWTSGDSRRTLEIRDELLTDRQVVHQLVADEDLTPVDWKTDVYAKSHDPGKALQNAGILWALGDRDKAFEQLDVALNSRSAEAVRSVALFFLEQNVIDRAERSAERLAEVSENSDEVVQAIRAIVARNRLVVPSFLV